MTISEADKKEHPANTQWHYAPLISHGFEALDKVRTGLVRSYRYIHPDGRTASATTGYSGDYWEARSKNDEHLGGGWYSSLEPFLKNGVDGNN